MAKPESIRILTENAFGGSDGPPRNVYLWEYQPHFAISVKLAAEALFKRLDDSLTPDAFLVAINTDESSSHPAVVVEPEDHEFRPDDFSKVLGLAKELQNASPDPTYLYSEGSKTGEAWAKQGERRDFLATIQRALLQTIEGRNRRESPKVYASSARELGPYAIYSVLLIEKWQYDAHPLLRKTRRDRYRVVPSLIDAAAEEFVDACSDAILLSFADKWFGEFPTTDSFLRAAGTIFMYTPFGACDNFHGLHGGFEACNEISTLTYEKAVGRGRLVLARNGHENVKLTVSFQDPPPVRTYRAVRKLLQMSQGDDALICDSYQIRGIGTVTDDYNTTDENLFFVEFVGHSKWELIHNKTVLMRVEHGIPKLPRISAQVRRFKETFARLFPAHIGRAVEFGRIAKAATELDHGTILIVTEDAAEESRRFGTQSARIEPQSLSDGLLHRASRIDGAILVSPDGNCHAIGVILDGRANDKGSAERGSRFNSTVRYVNARGCPCIGLIVSDDGMIDLVPEYHAVMSRGDIERQIERLRRLVAEPEASNRQLYKAIEWIRGQSFYLSQAQCDEVNRLIADARAIPGQGAINTIYSALEPTPEMNDSYLRE